MVKRAKLSICVSKERDLGAEAPVLGLFVAGSVMISIAAVVAELVLAYCWHVGVLEVAVVLLLIARCLVLVSRHKGHQQSK